MKTSDAHSSVARALHCISHARSTSLTRLLLNKLREDSRTLSLSTQYEREGECDEESAQCGVLVASVVFVSHFVYEDNKGAFVCVVSSQHGALYGHIPNREM